MDDLLSLLQSHGQGHLAEILTRNTPPQRDLLAKALMQIDWREVARAHREAGPLTTKTVNTSAYSPVSALQVTPEKARAWGRVGLDVLRRGEAAFVLLAGGQGTRLGFDGPKGAFPLGLPGGQTLFYLVASRLAALGRLSGAPPPPWVVMTSPLNHHDTAAWFNTHLPPDAAPPILVRQGTMPALDRRGRVLLSTEEMPAQLPDGNGGVFSRLEREGVWQTFADRGIRLVHLAGVDNALLRPCDPVLLGRAIDRGEPIVSKSVARRDTSEKVGVFANDAMGRVCVAEYSELPPQLADTRDAQGDLLFCEANIASHLLTLDSCRALARADLPWHLALKPSPHLNPDTGLPAPPDQVVCKYERFVFDGFADLGGTGVHRVRRDLEFSPVKNAHGPDSPASACLHLAQAASLVGTPGHLPDPDRFMAPG